MPVIAIANLKGGVGKTTLTMNLGWLLAQRGRRVLSIDMDGQRNLTVGWGLKDTDVAGLTSCEVIKWQKRLPDCVVPVPSHFLVPGALGNHTVDEELVSKQRREERLRHQLNEANTARDYDYVLIDCPPKGGTVMLNALYAASHVLVPVEPEFFSITSTIDFAMSLQDVRTYHPIVLLGLVPNSAERTNNDRQCLAYLNDLAKQWDVTMFPMIPHTTRIKNAIGAHIALSAYDRSNGAATALEKLAEQIDEQFYPVPMVQHA
jgi:chromosome partitioning protein